MEDYLQLDQHYNEEEQLIRATVMRFVHEQAIPQLPELYENAEFPREFIQQIADMGLLGMTLPVEYGGSEASSVAYGLACQALEYGDSGLRSFMSVQSSLCMYPIFSMGSEAQKQQYLAKMARGECIGCFGLTEPDSGSDPSSMATTATAVDGGWRLNGSKMWITNATIADIAIVWARTEDGIRGFIVPLDSDGVSRSEITQKLSLRASITGELAFNDVLLAEDALLPGSTAGLRAALSCLTQARFGIAWGVSGAAMACFDQALGYTKSRKQFAKPLAGFQLVQKDLVDMFTELSKMQVLNLHLARMKDSEQLAPELVSLAKRNACSQALAIARKARNLLGANGVALDYHVIRHMTNLESVFTYEGTDNVHTLILGRFLTGLNAFT